MSVPINALQGQGNNASAQTGSSSQMPGGNLGESAFLTLLAAELQYQNPLQPMNNTQFIAQLAQFSSLAAVTKQSTTLGQILSALQQQNPVVQLSQLIGKTVTTAQGQGVVTAVSDQGGQQMATVQGLGTVKVSDIAGIAG
ncbi:MAG: flagellar hook capping protein [Firmicutes bacterium]|jgi:flagellar basal-body rod modification protein FlgD|uniref:Flagellar hook capping protein n=1 Tax=Sulfobacillus benefaciens TaxID=453960 RepID=A0A2T2X6M4_9FIRM|nr:flagellar hook capping protein [Bacillota bacterium]MCL5015693.1 flagellar hook capping protein [Bacillota bacterium]PSR30117.1 MAG: flagellar hook capping protein [Sulfobacillus benefaciens]